HILSAADQLNLSKLKVFNFNDEIALLYFTTKLSFRRIFQEQITDPILLSENYFNEISCKNYTADVYEYILKFFENLKHLSLIVLFPKSFPPLLLRNLPLTSTFHSSTLYKLCIYVIYYDDFFALVDGSSYNATNVCNMGKFNLVSTDELFDEDFNDLSDVNELFQYIEQLNLHLSIENQTRFIDEDNVHLLDLPDELILIIMNKIKPRLILLSSIITVGNNLLEQLVLDKCNSVDLTFDYVKSPYKTHIEQFLFRCHVSYHHNIQSLALNTRHIHEIINFAKKNYNGTVPHLTHLKIMIDRQHDETGTPYTLDTSECIVPLLQRVANVEYLTLLLAINGTTSGLNDFVNGFDLKKHIVSYMPPLHQFIFHIRSILENPIHIEIDTIRHSCLKYQQESVDCTVNYFNNNHSQCQIYSLPCIGNRLDFISNQFSLFDDVKPFESLFFARLTRALPHLKTLELFNELEQQDKTTNNIEFTHLSTLIPFDIHMDYAEQFLHRSHLPCLIELAINKYILLTIIAQDQQQARDNCSNTLMQ
ncbi:unnamed protein product, partial [Rotaria sp. Silwood1]